MRHLLYTAYYYKYSRDQKIQRFRALAKDINYIEYICDDLRYDCRNMRWLRRVCCSRLLPRVSVLST
jgi:hypothetical protein